MLEELLARLDLHPSEITTYLYLLKTGPISAGALAKHTGIVRATQYVFLRQLIQKGFVTQSKRGSLQLFSAQSPEKLNHLYEEKIDRLEQDKKLYQKLLPSLLAQKQSSSLPPKFQIFEGKDGLKNVLKDMLFYRDTETQAYWPIKQMVEILGSAFFANHNRERIKRNLYTRAIWPQDQVLDLKTHPYLGTGLLFKREIRIAPKDAHFTMGYWIYGNKVAFLSSSKESYGYVIESAELSEMLRSQFELVWKLSKPLKNQPDHAKAFLQLLKDTSAPLP